MLKKIGYSFLILYNLFRCISSLNAQPSEFKWARWAGGISEDYSCSISSDKFGNTVITGYFSDIAYFWPYTLIADGGQDIFVTKYDKSGNVIWANRAGGTGGDEGHCVANDEFGNSIITGNFFGTGKFGSISLVSSGGTDVFISKYDELGNVQWAKSTGGKVADYGQGICSDMSGNIVVTGCFQDTINFDMISLASKGEYDIFIAKFDKLGNVIWAKNAGSPNSDIGRSIASDKQNNYYITGEFSGIATFDKTTIQGNGIFIAKYGSDGNLIWVKGATGTSTFESSSIAIDNSNNPIITGYFSGIASFGLENLHSAGDKDIFIAKYDASGNVLWAKRAGGTAYDVAHDISTDYFSNPIITGAFRGNSNFGSHTLNSLDGSPDIFIAKYNTLGDVLWVKQAGGKGYDAALSIVSDKNGTNTITGFFEGAATFDKINLTSAGDRDIFVAQFEEKINLPDTIPTAPKNLAAIPGDQKVTLFWSQNPESDLSHYQIYRSQLHGFIPAITDTLAIVMFPDNSYIDTEVINGLTYYYRISAVNVAGDESDYSAEASATPQAGITMPNIGVSALEHNFGDVPLFSTASWQVIIENQGAANLEVNNIVSDNSVFSANTRQFIIEPGSGHSVYVQFTPDSLQAERGAVTIFSNDPDQPEIKIALSGKGIDNQAPEIILPTPTQKMWISADYLLSAQIKDNWAIKSALLFYRKGSDGNFQSLALSQGQGDNYFVTILSSALTFSGLAYFIKAEDSAGNTTFSDTVSQAIYFQDRVLSTSRIPCPYQAGYPRGEWHQISVPAMLDQSGASAVLNDEIELGNYGEPNWRLFSYQDTNGDNIADGYVEYRSDLESSVFRFDSGKAFWLKANPDGAKIEIDVGAGHVLPLEPQTIPLKPGWNQIGNPFAFPIAFAPNDSRIVNKLYLPNGSGGYQLTTTMQPWAGYFLFVNGNAAVDLKLAPKPGNPLNKTIADEAEWMFQINASCGTSRDEINFLGISETSIDGWDSNDYPEPPAIGEYISLYFPHEDWQEGCKNFTTDFRNSVGEGQIWNLMVKTNQKSSEVNLSWSQLIAADENLQFQLYDCNRNMTIDMEKARNYRFSRLNQEMNSPFQILVGSSEFVERQVAEIQSRLPKDFCLFQNYPNPFNSTTQIRFQLPSAEKVSLKILNVMGREVRSLLNEHRAAGNHQISWDGIDNQGNEAGTGVYLCVFQAGPFFESRKVLVLK